MVVEMDPEKRERIGEFADAVRSALRLPVPTTIADIERAVRELGGAVVREPHFDHEASIRRTSSRDFEIALDPRKPPTRQLFSLGHELGHLFVHMGFGNSKRWDAESEYRESYARSGYDEEEFVAHEFAAALLMPQETFKEMLENGSSTGDIARFFGVSEEAALMRGRWLGVVGW